MMKACATCPWRKGARADTMPGGFDVAWARGLRDACRESDGLDAAVLTCHHRELDIDSVCVGFLNDQVREGVPNLAVRFAVMRKVLALPDEPDPELLSYEDMIDQMEADSCERGGLCRESTSAPDETRHGTHRASGTGTKDAQRGCP